MAEVTEGIAEEEMAGDAVVVTKGGRIKGTKMHREHLKAVVWPRGPVDKAGGKVYRYVVIGVVVSDKPIESLEGKNTHGLSEYVVDEDCSGLAGLLGSMATREPNLRLGDAVDVLSSLADI